MKRRDRWIWVVPCLAIGCLSWSCTPRTQPGVTVERVHVLDDSEGIFAYSRISPDGRLLAYTSLRAQANGTSMNVRVVDLESGAVVFETKGLDAYWSPNGRELIFLDQSTSADSVSTLEVDTRRVRRDVAPPDLGDYFSWGMDGGRSVIATNEHNYYYLEDGKAVLPANRIVPCGDAGARYGPFISKDGRRVAAFEGRTIVVRNLDDCRDMIRTGMEGGKADFSYDGRYIAFHALKPERMGYEVKVVDLVARTVRAAADLPGSGFYPSWTADGRLCFRYDAGDFRGFVVVSNFLTQPSEPLPADVRVTASNASVRWGDLFMNGDVQVEDWGLVLVWAPWCTHCGEAFRELREAVETWRAAGWSVSLFAAAEPNSRPEDVETMTRLDGIVAPALQMKHDGVYASGAANQLPTVLLFAGERLVGRKLGTQRRDEVIRWIRGAGGQGA